MPQAARKGAFEATARFPCNNSERIGGTSRGSRTKNDLPRCFSKFWAKRVVYRLRSKIGIFSLGAVRVVGSRPAALSKALRTFPRTTSREFTWAPRALSTRSEERRVG